MLFIDVEEFNCDVINYSSRIGDDSMLLKYLEGEGKLALVFAREIKSSRQDNEKATSFICLFNTFLKTMGNKNPITLMTDQSATTDAIIGLVVCNEGEHMYEYILKRWIKDIDLSLAVARRQMLRKFSNLISANELNMNARECIEEGFRMMKDKIASEVGPYYVDSSNNEVGSSNIKDLVGSPVKGECNKRRRALSR
ncbi:hypothetical protein M9H77_17493 [Catharanthus roseus]|uniref:Uncharacterized protein n=1 Tax=Catharanthus roseus TaxID=4058 RepID=A0ACC0B4Q1_CATRO|nr:hypothetical protein M9H77_17493 [Catharanthus roseus]